jgi:ankyrin repeat protein
MGNIHSAAVGSSCTRADTVKACLRCAESGDVAELGLILDADVRYVLHSSVFGGNSAWHKAAKGGRADALEALRAAVLAQYELDSKDVSEAAVVRPALLRLGSSGADAIARLINKPNIKGLTPLMLACTGGHTECAAWLIGHGE